MQKEKIRRIVAGAFAMLGAGSITVTLPAHAADAKITGEFGWFGVGKAHQIEKGHFYWVGEFSDTFFNDKGEGSTFYRAGVTQVNWADGTSSGYSIWNR